MWVIKSNEQVQALVGPYKMIYNDCDYGDNDGDNCNFNT